MAARMARMAAAVGVGVVSNGRKSAIVGSYLVSHGTDSSRALSLSLFLVRSDLSSNYLASGGTTIVLPSKLSQWALSAGCPAYLAEQADLPEESVRMNLNVVFSVWLALLRERAFKSCATKKATN